MGRWGRCRRHQPDRQGRLFPVTAAAAKTDAAQTREVEEWGVTATEIEARRPTGRRIWGGGRSGACGRDGGGGAGAMGRRGRRRRGEAGPAPTEESKAGVMGGSGGGSVGSEGRDSMRQSEGAVV